MGVSVVCEGVVPGCWRANGDVVVTGGECGGEGIGQ